MSFIFLQNFENITAECVFTSKQASYLKEYIDIPTSDNRYRTRKVCLIFIETFVCVLCGVLRCDHLIMNSDGLQITYQQTLK